MKTYSKRFLAFFLSLMIVISSTQSAYAASPSGWSVSPADIIMNGASGTITAIKGAGASALQSTVNHAPTVANIGKKILKGAGYAAVAYAVTELVGAGVDWVLDPANNRIKYTNPADAQPGQCLTGGKYYDTPNAYAVVACSNDGGFKSLAPHPSLPGYLAQCQSGNKHYFTCQDYVPLPPEPKYIPIPTVAAKVQSNAAAGHAPSQELIKTVIIDDVNAGVIDTPLNTNAVPVADAPPVNPPWDPSQPVPPFDPSSIIAAIKSVMAAVVNMSGVLGAKIDALMIDLGLKHDEKLAADAANTAEIVAANDRTGAQVAAIAAAIADIEGNTLDGKVINDAIDRVIAEGKTNTADIVAAIEAIEGNTLDGQVINDAVDRVIANDNVNAQAAAEAAEAAEAARAADAQAAAEAAEAAEAARAADAQEAKEAADAKAAADAAAFEWAKEAPEAPTDTGVIVDEPMSDFDSDKSYITFTGSCPPKYTASLNVMGATAPFEFDYTPICTVMSALKPFIVGAGYIVAAYIIAGHSRGSKD